MIAKRNIQTVCGAGVGRAVPSAPFGSRLTLAMNLLGALASRRLVGSQKPKFAGETPALPECELSRLAAGTVFPSVSIRSPRRSLAKPGVHPWLKVFSQMA